MNKRLNYVDNLRWFLIALLILYHVAMAYNTWGEANYIFLEVNKPIASIVSFMSPWFMPLMFLLAGISSYYSLEKRGIKSFILERLIRIGIPFIFGILFINPILSYIADVTHNGYSGNYFEHYGVYFTKYTDLSGYDGGFTLGHFWFLAVLLLISFVSLIFVVIAKNIPEEKKKTVLIIFAVIASVIAIATFNVDILGERIITYLFIYLIGYFAFGKENITAYISKFKWIFFALFLVTNIANVVLFIYVGGYETLNTIMNYLSFVFGVLGLFTFAHDHLDFANGFTKKCASLSYVFYICHFPIVVLAQYLFMKLEMNNVLNFFVATLVSYVLTAGLTYGISYIPYVRIVFGLKR